MHKQKLFSDFTKIVIISISLTTIFFAVFCFKDYTQFEHVNGDIGAWSAKWRLGPGGKGVVGVNMASDEKEDAEKIQQSWTEVEAQMIQLLPQEISSFFKELGGTWEVDASYKVVKLPWSPTWDLSRNLAGNRKEFGSNSQERKDRAELEGDDHDDNDEEHSISTYRTAERIGNNNNDDSDEEIVVYDYQE